MSEQTVLDPPIQADPPEAPDDAPAVPKTRKRRTPSAKSAGKRGRPTSRTVKASLRRIAVKAEEIADADDDTRLLAAKLTGAHSPGIADLTTTIMAAKSLAPRSRGRGPHDHPGRQHPRGRRAPGGHVPARAAGTDPARRCVLRPDAAGAAPREIDRRRPSARRPGAGSPHRRQRPPTTPRPRWPNETAGRAATHAELTGERDSDAHQETQSGQ